jgi:DNA invertase Pin-like site-specific DNA recombinase
MGDYIGYIRVSTSMQGESGLGIEAQGIKIAGWAGAIETESQLRPDITETKSQRHFLCLYREVESGRHCDRPILAEALEHCRRVGATLVIAKLDRLARDPDFIGALLKGDVPFIALDLPSANRFTIRIFAALAEEEARLIGERTKAALAVAKARGVKLGGNRGHLDRALAARQAKRAGLYAAWRAQMLPRVLPLRQGWHGLGYGAIAQRLNREGARTLTGKPLLPVTIRDLLLGRPCDRAAQRKAKAPAPSKESALF